MSAEPPPRPGQPTAPAIDYDVRYRKGWAYGKAPSKFLVEAAADHLAGSAAPLDILSLGEGQGRHAVFLASLGHRCVGVDSSKVGLAKAAALAEDHGVAALVKTVHADLADYNPSAGGAASWDAVISIYCALEPTLRLSLHRACARALRPGGVVIVETFAPNTMAVHRPPPTTADSVEEHSAEQQRSWQRAGPTDTSRLVDSATLADDFAGLTVVVAREVEVTLAEGRFHRGPAVLTQFIACKPMHDVPSPCAAYRLAIDHAFAAALMPPQLPDASAGAPSMDSTESIAAAAAAEYAADGLAAGADKQLFCAEALVRIACGCAAQTGRCRYCWLPGRRCVCDALTLASASNADVSQVADRPQPHRPRVDWVILSHPAEFLRATSTAKIAAQLLGRSAATGGTGDVHDTCEWLLYGCKMHLERLDQLLRECHSGGGALRVLFPCAKDDVGDSASEVFAAVRAGSTGAHTDVADEADTPSSPSPSSPSSSRARLVILVPDGSWECAKALVADVRRRAAHYTDAPIRYVYLDPSRVAAHSSPLLDALHAGAGRGRLSTIEACALFLEEAHGDSDSAAAARCEAQALRASLSLIVEYVRTLRHEEGVGEVRAVRGGGGAERAHPQHADWVVAIEAAARAHAATHACPRGLRRCCVCGAALSTHLRMQQHLHGRRHCEAVAKRWLHGAAPDLVPTADAARAALHEFSTVPLLRREVEPPDLALAAVSEALGLATVGVA